MSGDDAPIGNMNLFPKKGKMGTSKSVKKLSNNLMKSTPSEKNLYNENLTSGSPAFTEENLQFTGNNLMTSADDRIPFHPQSLGPDRVEETPRDPEFSKDSDDPNFLYSGGDGSDNSQSSDQESSVSSPSNMMEDRKSISDGGKLSLTIRSNHHNSRHRR